MELAPASKKSAKKKPLSLRNSTALNNSESSLVTTTTQVPAKDVPSVAVNSSATETVNSSAPATSTAVKSEPMDYSRSDSVQSSVLPPSQPTKVLNVLLFICYCFLSKFVHCFVQACKTGFEILFRHKTLSILFVLSLQLLLVFNFTYRNDKFVYYVVLSKTALPS